MLYKDGGFDEIEPKDIVFLVWSVRLSLNVFSDMSARDERPDWYVRKASHTLTRIREMAGEAH